MALKYLDTWTKERTTGALDGWQRLKIATGPLQLISGLDPTKLALIPDVSHWNGACDIKRMVTEGKIAALVAKCSDGWQMIAGTSTDLQTYKDDTLDANIQKCYEAGIPCLVYHFCQYVYANWTLASIVDHQYRVIMEALKGKVPGVSFHGIVLDVEVTNSTGYIVSEVTMTLYRKLAAAFPTLPIIIYTSMSILNLYPQLREQISAQGMDYHLWMAQWVYNTSITTTWENLWSTIIPRLDVRVLTPGFATWKLYQWTGDRVKVPGCNGAIDLNFFKGTTPELYTWLNYKQAAPVEPPAPEPEPEPEPAPVITRAEFDALAARVKALEDWRKS